MPTFFFFITHYAQRSGVSGNKVQCGIFDVFIVDIYSHAFWSIGAVLSLYTLYSSWS